MKAPAKTSAYVVGRPAHVPKPEIRDDPAVVRRLLSKALNEPNCLLRVKFESVVLSLRVLSAEFVGDSLKVEWQSAFSRDPEVNLPSPEAGTFCTWLALAGGRGAVGFRAEVLESRPAGARIKVPGKVVFQQMRQEIRYKIPAGYEMSASLRGSTADAAKIFDVSASGISILVDADQAFLWAPKGTRPQRLSFRIHGKTITADILPVAGPPSESRPRQEQRLRFKFDALPESDQNLIRLFVVDHMVSLDIDSEA